jgi:hypothetical protein
MYRNTYLEWLYILTAVMLKFQVCTQGSWCLEGLQCLNFQNHTVLTQATFFLGCLTLHMKTLWSCKTSRIQEQQRCGCHCFCSLKIIWWVMFITPPTKVEVQRLTLKVKALNKFGNYWPNNLPSHCRTLLWQQILHFGYFSGSLSTWVWTGTMTTRGVWKVVGIYKLLDWFLFFICMSQTLWLKIQLDSYLPFFPKISCLKLWVPKL